MSTPPKGIPVLQGREEVNMRTPSSPEDSWKRMLCVSMLQDETREPGFSPGLPRRSW
jgi:hypothetical protein